MKAPIAISLLLAPIGAAFLLANRRLPLVRNGLVYASATRHVVEHGTVTDLGRSLFRVET